MKATNCSPIWARVSGSTSRVTCSIAAKDLKTSASEVKVIISSRTDEYYIRAARVQARV